MWTLGQLQPQNGDVVRIPASRDGDGHGGLPAWAGGIPVESPWVLTGSFALRSLSWTPSPQELCFVVGLTTAGDSVPEGRGLNFAFSWQN